jgi:CcmD family protein
VIRADPSGARHLAAAPVDLTAQTLETDVVSSLGYLAAVNVVVWVGLFLYLWRLDRRLRIAERERGR